MVKTGPKKKARSKVRKPRSVSLRDDDWRYVAEKGRESDTSASGYIEYLIRRDRDENSSDRDGNSA